jgi:hypothetical protein
MSIESHLGSLSHPSVQYVLQALGRVLKRVLTLCGNAVKHFSNAKRQRAVLANRRTARWRFALETKERVRPLFKTRY